MASDKQSERPPLRDALFTPQSVALVGVSDDATKTTARPLRFLKQHGFQGKVYPVNPKRKRVQGQTAYPSLDALPEVPDHVFVLVNAAATLDAVAAAGAMGVPAATLLADGFADAGAEGRRRQEQLLEISDQTGIRLIGPNSLGVVNVTNGLALTANAAFAEKELQSGSVALLSQSGSMIGGLMSRALSLGLGFSKLVSVGNEADLTVGAIGRLLLDDPETNAFLVFLETIRDAEEMASFAAEAHARAKPVLAFTLGRSGEGRELAVLHTGALLSDGASVEAFLRDAGIARLQSFEGLLEAIPLFVGRRPLNESNPRIGVVTTTGGGGASLVDALSVTGLALGRASEDTLEAIRQSGIHVSAGPMVDVTLAGAQYDIMRGTLETMTRADEFDAVLVAVGSSARFNPELALQPIIDCEKHGKPVGAFLVPDAPDAVRAMSSAGVPVFRSTWSCADAVRAWAEWQSPRPEAGQRSVAAHHGTVAALDEAAALSFLSGAGVPTVPHVVAELDEIGKIELPFSFPVVAKVLAEEIAHKTEAGGVVVGIENRAALVEAASRIKASVEAHQPGIVVRRVLIAPKVDALGEALIGLVRDVQVGPVITLAPGGVLAELYNDKAVRLAPVDVATALEMVFEIKGFAPLCGYRNLPKGDLQAFAEAIAAFSQLATDPQLMDAEVNPLLIWQDGVVAVDALVRLVR